MCGRWWHPASQPQADPFLERMTKLEVGPSGTQYAQASRWAERIGLQAFRVKTRPAYMSDVSCHIVTSCCNW